MKFISLSSHLNIERKTLEQHGVFDATLGIDTPLFLDPKLLVNTEIPELESSRDNILNYFRDLIRRHKQSDKSERIRKITEEMLAVPEPTGTSIGYGSKSDKGTSISKTVARKILRSISEILSIGIDDPEVVELLGLFIGGFGPDSISDLIIHIIYFDLCIYTERVSRDLKLETKEFTIDGRKFRLPEHPFTGKQIIFIPFTLLRDLPIATSWEDIESLAQHNEDLRRDFDDIVLPVLGEAITDVSQKNDEEKIQISKNFASLLNLYKKLEVDSYNLSSDKKGYYGIDPFVESQKRVITSSNKPKNQEQLIKAIADLIEQFRRSIEDNGGNQLLFHKTSTGKLIKDKPHNEDVSQRIFYMIADLYCRQADIALSGESDAGRGPVDFSLATGYESKVIVEIKKSTNKNLESGFKKQVTAYAKSENAMHSFYVVLLVKEEPKKRDTQSQLDTIIKLHEENTTEGITSPQLIIIDGLVKPSPSKLK